MNKYNFESLLPNQEKLTIHGKQLKALCPFHNDHNPSFSADTETGLWKCFSASCGAEGNYEAFLARRGAGSVVDVSGTRKNINHYIYHKINGTSGIRVTRTEPKGFFQEVCKDNKWVKRSGEKIEVVPYNYFQWKDDDIIFLVEGEKCSTTLAEKFDLNVTTTIGGSSSWKKSYSKFFKDKKVYIIPDNDEAGEKYANNALNDLSGVAKEVCIVNLANLEEKEDIYDWIEKGGTKEELLDLVKHQVKSLYENFVEPQKVFGLYDECDYEIDWLIDNFIARKTINLLVAKPKIGKSTLARFMASKLTKGVPCLKSNTKKSSVILLNFENLKNQVVAHFKFLDVGPSEELYLCQAPFVEDPIKYLEFLCEQCKPDLFIIDPLQMFVSLKDSNNYESTMSQMMAFKKICEEKNVSFLFIHHAKKGAVNGSDSVLGSTALFGICDSLIILSSTKKGLRIQTEARYSEGMKPHELKLAENGIFELGEICVDEADDNSLEELICTAIDGVELTKDEISKKLNIGDKKLTRHLNDLKYKGLIEQVGKGVKNQKHKFIKVTTEEHFLQ